MGKLSLVEQAVNLLKKHRASDPMREWLVIHPQNTDRWSPLVVKGENHSVSLDEWDYNKFQKLAGSGDEFADFHNHPDSSAPLPSIPDLGHFLSGTNIGVRPSRGTYGVLADEGLTAVMPTTDDFPAMDANDTMQELYQRLMYMGEYNPVRAVRAVDGMILGPTKEAETMLNMGILNSLSGKGALHYSLDNVPNLPDPQQTRDLWRRLGGDAMMAPYCEGGYVDASDV